LALSVNKAKNKEVERILGNDKLINKIIEY